MVKSGEIKVGKKKERDTSVTPNKSQSNKLMDRVEKLLAQSNNQNNIKYIKWFGMDILVIMYLDFFLIDICYNHPSIVSIFLMKFSKIW